MTELGQRPEDAPSGEPGHQPLHAADRRLDLAFNALTSTDPDAFLHCLQREGATTIRNLLQLSARRTWGDVAEITVKADAFCHSMVRSLVGALVAVASGQRDADWLAGLLDARERVGELPDVRGFANVEGLGVWGRVAAGGGPGEGGHDDAVVVVGRPALLAERNMPLPAELRRAMDAAAEQGQWLPFVVLQDAVPVGSTSFLHPQAEIPSVEIGATWLGPAARRTGVNTVAKSLLLTHAFDVWGCRWVTFRATWWNRASRAAIERIGASFEGRIRNDRVTREGLVTDSAQYAITDAEWPAVRRHLQFLREHG